MKITRIVFLLLTFIAVNNITAQKKFLNTCDKPERVILTNNESFLNNCDSAYVMNSAAARVMFGTLEQKTAIIDSLEKQKSVLKNIIAKQDSVIIRLGKIISVQDTSYSKIKEAQNKTSDLVNNSIDNTKRALSYARKLKYTSYLTSFAVGGIAGGLIDNKVYKFGTGGALLGALCGAAVNYLIQDLILGD